MSKLTRTALSAFAAIGVIGATGVVGVASAAATDTPRTPVVELSAQIARLSTSDAPRLPIVKGLTITTVESKGHTTGSPTSGAGCQNYANVVNGLIGDALQDLYAGYVEDASATLAQAVTLLNEAEEVGCVLE